MHIGKAFASHTVLGAAARFAFGARIASPESIFRLLRLVAKRDWLGSQSGVMLLDQGFLQDLWSIVVAAKLDRVEPAALSPLIRALYDGIDATIVVIDVDPLTAASRVRERDVGNSRFDGLPESELRSSLVSISEVHWQIVEAAKLAGLAIRAIDGSKRPENVMEELQFLLPAEGSPMPAPAGQRPRRISIVGPTGSGKSFLAKQLAKQLDLPAHELDEVRRSETGAELSRESFQERVAQIVEGDAWIIDGHYRDVRHQIWARADIVVWLNYPLNVVAKRVYGRFRRKQRSTASAIGGVGGEQTSASMTSGHQTASWTRRLNRLSRTLRERREYGQILRSPAYPGLSVVELRSIPETERWLQSL